MADESKKAIDKTYLSTQFQNFLSDVIVPNFVQAQKNYSLISKTDLAQITTNQLAIEDLKTNTSNAAINALIAAQIAKVVDNAPTDFDTLKEISDWISTHASSASAMNSSITDLKSYKADSMSYDDEKGILSLLSGDTVLKSVAVSSGSGQSHYLTYPEFEMNYDTGHIWATGGTGVDFVISSDGHLESEVL